MTGLPDDPAAPRAGCGEPDAPAAPRRTDDVAAPRAKGVSAPGEHDGNPDGAEAEPGDAFDAPYWQRRWRDGHDGNIAAMASAAPNPYLVEEIAALRPGTALDAGCGAGAEAIWLSRSGWRVTAVDISADALRRAEQRRQAAEVDPVDWVCGDLTAWQPAARFDLVATHYAHAAIPQLALYERLAAWVAPGGTLLIVGHAPGGGHGHDAEHAPGEGHSHGSGSGPQDGPPAGAVAAIEDIVARLDRATWRVVTAQERVRPLPGVSARLHDVVVRAGRRAG